MPTDPDSLSTYPLDIDPSRLDSTEDYSGGLRPAESPSALNRSAEMQLRLSKMEKSVAGHVYNPAGEVDGASYSYYPGMGPVTFPDQQELQAAYTGHNVRYMSPSGSWGGDRSMTELESAPSEGSQSPRSGWNYNSPYMQPEYNADPMVFSPCAQIHQAVEPTDLPFPTGDELLYPDRSVTTPRDVTPQEVLHYPDPDLESATYGLRSLGRGDGMPNGLDINQEHEDSQERCYPAKRMKFTSSPYLPSDSSPTSQNIPQNKAKPSMPSRNTRANTHTRNGAGGKGGVRSKETKSSPKQAGKQNAARLFICSFSHYGCPSTFRTKNEWKRHVTSQHLRLRVFRCDVGSCNINNTAKEKKQTWGPSSRNRIASSQQSCEHHFNRKDLFTQHQRRMHKPKELITNPSCERLKNAFEASLEQVRQRCWVEIRQPPDESYCGFCGRGFQGPKSWEERMEHVGKHFERGEKDEREDEGLREWALSEGLIRPSEGGFVLA